MTVPKVLHITKEISNLIKRHHSELSLNCKLFGGVYVGSNGEVVGWG